MVTDGAGREVVHVGVAGCHAECREAGVNVRADDSAFFDCGSEFSAKAADFPDGGEACEKGALELFGSAGALEGAGAGELVAIGAAVRSPAVDYTVVSALLSPEKYVWFMTYCGRGNPTSQA